MIELAKLRLAEAQSLLAAGYWSGAYYLAGYSVECALKSVISLQFKAEDIPELEKVRKIYTHNLNELLERAHLNNRLQRAQQSDPGLEANWATVSDWKETKRYEIIEQASAAAIVAAVGDPKCGVTPWILTHSSKEELPA